MFTSLFTTTYYQPVADVKEYSLDLNRITCPTLHRTTTYSDDGNTVTVTIDVPGVKRDDVELNADSDSVEFSITRSNGRKHNYSYALDNLKQSGYDTDSLEAKLEYGQLKLSFPKLKTARKKRVELK